VSPPRVLAEEIFQDLGCLRIEADHRLVHHDHRRAMHEGAGDDQLLPHPVAVALDELVAPFLEVEQRQQLARSALHRRALVAIEARHEAQELHRGELLVDERPVGNEAQRRLGGRWILGDVDTGDAHPAAARPQDAGDHAERRGLPGAVGPEKAKELPTRHREVDRVHGRKAAVTLGESDEFDHRRLGRSDG
jgi:hypothetical protein